MANRYLALGLMSGTSIDAIDVALIETDGLGWVRPLRSSELSWSVEDRNLIEQASPALRRSGGRLNDDADVRQATDHVTRAHIKAISHCLDRWNMWPSQLDCIGFHGQTLFHAPDDRITIQVGNAGELVNHFGVPVVADFRSADVNAGGQGAPLIPIYHQAVVAQLGLSLPVALVNIGGVANISYVSAEELIGFDTGPGNGPIDSWMQDHNIARFDENGRAANTGTIDQTCLERWLQNDYFDAAWPKSLDRHDFSFPGLSELNINDGAATLTAFTAETIARAVNQCPGIVQNIIITGGGAKNPTLMRQITERSQRPVSSLAQFGWSPDSLEAEGFAYLAVRRLNNQPATFPSTTGVSHPMTAGRIFDPE